MENEIYKLAGKLGSLLKAKEKKIATAESCTGGWIAQAITDIPGSSAWFDRGFVTYSDLSKMEMLGVNRDTLERYGAVSEETVREMTAGALEYSTSDCSIAVSGIAGPDGGTPEKPVGTVVIGWQERDQEPKSLKLQLKGSRQDIRRETVIKSLVEMCRIVSGEGDLGF